MTHPAVRLPQIVILGNEMPEYRNENTTERTASSTAGGWPALVLLGPTGSGKTPLGEMLARRGLWQRPCVHFDFGANLREVAGQSSADGFLTPDEVEFIRHVLRQGILLEDEHFPIARRVLLRFLDRAGAGPDRVVVLNGLPRHVGQAVALRQVVEVKLLVYLDCSDAVVLERIGTNAGGDRTGRDDDEQSAVLARLATFRRRTVPLVEHYRHGGVPICRLPVTATMTAEQMWQWLERSDAVWSPGGCRSEER